MCGIAGVHRFGDAYIPGLDRFVDELLLGIEHRGMHATGYGYLCDDKGARVQKASMRATNFIKHRTEIPWDARTIILHTRFATNGDPAFPENNHPTVAGSIMSVHNGVIHNDDELFKRVTKHDRLGRVDSEVVPALVNEFGIDNIDTWIEELEGSYALAILDANRPGEVSLIRGNSSPLYIYRNRRILVWASTADTITKAWAKVFGTPPKGTKVEYIREGTRLDFDKHGLALEASFTPYEDAWYTRVVSGRGYNNNYRPPVDNSSKVQVVETSRGVYQTVQARTQEATQERQSYIDWWSRCDVCMEYVEENDHVIIAGRPVCEECLAVLGQGQQMTDGEYTAIMRPKPNEVKALTAGTSRTTVTPIRPPGAHHADARVPTPASDQLKGAAAQLAKEAVVATQRPTLIPERPQVPGLRWPQ